ncbi:Co-chaperone Hsc20 [Hypoxylon cercidicola]|nr:Co-chaperone Hsc20 [Hypoxylon cercidicola]
MRSSLLPRRPLRRVCNACKQQQQRQLNPSSKNFSHAASIAVVPSRTPSQTTNSRASVRRTLGSIPQTRSISNAASASAPRPAPEEPETRPPARTHYDLFPQTLPLGPPPAGPFAVDARALRREFLTLQATAHPDVAAGAGRGAHKRRAEAASARINEAYRTLGQALPRAQYLLWLRGMDVANEEAARVEDPELLLLVLETREAIEEAAEEGELEPLREANEARIRESEGRLARAFAEDDLEGARHEVTRLRYWVNIRESIHNWERGKPVVLEH